MPTICPKCSYARKDTDSAPEWQCPSCQVAYKKVGDAPYVPRQSTFTVHTGYVAEPEKTSHAWKWILAIAVVAGVAWQSGYLSKRATTSASESASADGQPAVVMYTTASCGYCRAARQFFDKSGIAYTDLDINQSEKNGEEFRKLGGRGVPLILVGEEKMVGFNAQLLQAKLEPWMKQ